MCSRAARGPMMGMGIVTFVRRHPLTAYFVLAYAVAWGGVALVNLLIGPTLLTLFLAMAAGPTTAGLVLTGVIDGGAGYRNLFRRLVRWRVGPHWYAAALLLNPLVLLLVLGALTFVSIVYVPGIFTADNPAALAALAAAGGAAAGLFEEIGWTGFATPRLLQARSPFHAGLLLGLLWATWHIGPDVPGTAREWGGEWGCRILCWMYAGMVPYRVLMTWVYRHTGSLLLGVGMHAAYTGGQFLLEPRGVGHTEYLVWWALLGAGLWVAVAVVAFVDREHLLERAHAVSPP